MPDSGIEGGPGSPGPLACGGGDVLFDPCTDAGGCAQPGGVPGSETIRTWLCSSVGVCSWFAVSPARKRSGRIRHVTKTRSGLRCIVDTLVIRKQRRSKSMTRMSHTFELLIPLRNKGEYRKIFGTERLSIKILSRIYPAHVPIKLETGLNARISR